MPMNAAYLNAIRDAGQGLITHIGLVDAGGTELSGGGYARQPVTWTDENPGNSRPSATLGETRASNPVFRPKSEAEWLRMFGG